MFDLSLFSEDIQEQIKFGYHVNMCKMLCQYWEHIDPDIKITDLYYNRAYYNCSHPTISQLDFANNFIQQYDLAKENIVFLDARNGYLGVGFIVFDEIVVCKMFFDQKKYDKIQGRKKAFENAYRPWWKFW